jgi:hypothetical protein
MGEALFYLVDLVDLAIWEFGVAGLWDWLNR